MNPGTEYFSMMIRINSAKTVGACPACSDPVCLVLSQIIIGQGPDHTPAATLNAPLNSNYVTWQGGEIGGAGCPGATPTLNRTWGQLKSVYR